jgi:hypothetical protein
MRKFILSGAVLGALFGGIGVIQQTTKGPRDWRLALLWISWLATLGYAIGSVAQDAAELEREQNK